MCYNHLDLNFSAIFVLWPFSNKSITWKVFRSYKDWIKVVYLSCFELQRAIVDSFLTIYPMFYNKSDKGDNGKFWTTDLNNLIWTKVQSLLKWNSIKGNIFVLKTSTTCCWLFRWNGHGLKYVIYGRIKASSLSAVIQILPSTSSLMLSAL